MPTPEQLDRVAKALHLYHGKGYCSMGAHNRNTTYACQQEAAVILDAYEAREEPRVRNPVYRQEGES